MQSLFYTFYSQNSFGPHVTYKFCLNPDFYEINTGSIPNLTTVFVGGLYHDTSNSSVTKVRLGPGNKYVISKSASPLQPPLVDNIGMYDSTLK